MESTRAYQEVVETDFLATAALAFPDADPYLVNGIARKSVSSAANNNVFDLEYLILMNLAFNKANVPQAGRVFIVDPTVEATILKGAQITHDVSEFGRQLLEGKLTGSMRYTLSLFGWDIFVSNRLYKGPADDGTNSLAEGVYNIFMCILDDQTKPIMHAVRRMPKVEGKKFALSSLNNVEEFALAA